MKSTYQKMENSQKEKENEKTRHELLESLQTPKSLEKTSAIIMCDYGRHVFAGKRGKKNVHHFVADPPHSIKDDKQSRIIHVP